MKIPPATIDSFFAATSSVASFRKIVLGAVAAFGFWFILFSPWFEWTALVHDHYFWYGMTSATAFLAAATIVLQRKILRRLFAFEPKFVLIGIVHAILLYALSRFGVFLLSWLFTGVVPQIQAVYVTRTQLDPQIIAFLLVTVIAPCEEVFWRGLVVDSLLSIVPARWALAIGTALYCVVHIWALNPMLMVAAFVLGAHWTVLYWRYRSLIPGIISHAVWDVAIFVIFPITF